MLTQKNYMKLEFPARSVNEGFARAAVAVFAAQLDPTLAELGDIKTAVSEAVTNAVVHAYPDVLGTVQVRVRILPDERDAEECLSDVWIRTWNSIPPEKPRALGAFLARIARNLALDKLSYNGAGKRASALTEAFEELEPCLVGADDTQKSVEASEFSIWLQAFLRAQTRENRVFFVRRYWYGESVSEIAAACGCSAEKVKSSLFRTRNRLREAMLKEDIAI